MTDDLQAEHETGTQRIRARQAYLSRTFLDWLHDELWTSVKEGRHPKTNGTPVTMEQWGRELAKLVGRPKPFGKSQLSKFIAGISTPVDIAEAMTAYFDIPFFAIAADTIEEVEWFLAGQALRKSDPEDFRKLLRNAQARTGLNREIALLEDELQAE